MLKASKPFTKLEKTERDGWLALLEKHLNQTHPYAWMSTLYAAAKKAGLGKVPKALSIAVESALGVRDPQAPVVLDEGGEPLPDKEQEDYESVPLDQEIGDYMSAEVLPHEPNAWVDDSYVDEQDGRVGKIGFEISFNRYFYKYVPPRDLHEIDTELKAVEAEIAALLDEVAE